jgi:hypothetical protein
MSIENHVVSLEVAKKLKPYLPVGFESIYNWFIFSDGTTYLGTSGSDAEECLLMCTGRSYKVKEAYPSPILTELTELLPRTIRHKGKCYNRMTSCVGDLDDITYYNWGKCYADESRDLMEQEDINHGGFSTDKKENIIDMTALLYIWLVDNKYIEVER